MPVSELPAELAAQMLEREAAEGPPDLTPADRELFTCLSEELAEGIQELAKAIQCCTKILRFGLRENPWTGIHNRDSLESELGDVSAFATLLERSGVINLDRVEIRASAKLRALSRNTGRLRSVIVEP